MLDSENMKYLHILFSLTLVCSLAACSKKADTQTSSGTSTTQTAQGQDAAATTAAPATSAPAPQVSSDPLVEAAQKIINSNYSYNGFACTTLSTVSPSLDNHSFTADAPVFFKDMKFVRRPVEAQQWAFIAKQGAAKIKDVTATDGNWQKHPAFQYWPDLKLKEADGKGYFHSTADDNNDALFKANTHYCYGKWTVTKVLDNDVKMASADPNMKKIAVQVELTDAPAWTKTKDADILNQATSEFVEPMPTYDDMNQPAPASLSTPARVLLDVPK